MNLKSFKMIPVAVCATMFLSGCTKQAAPPAPSNTIVIQLGEMFSSPPPPPAPTVIPVAPAQPDEPPYVYRDEPERPRRRGGYRRRERAEDLDTAGTRGEIPQGTTRAPAATDPNLSQAPAPETGNATE